MVHELTIRCRVNRGGVSGPCSLFLWRRGRRSGPSLEHWSGVVVIVVRPWSTGATWSSHQILCVVGTPGLPRSGCGGECASHYGRTMREAEAWSVPRLPRGGGVSAGANPKIAETLVYSAEASSGRLIVGTVLGHSGR